MIKRYGKPAGPSDQVAQALKRDRSIKMARDTAAAGRREEARFKAEGRPDDARFVAARSVEWDKWADALEAGDACWGPS